MLEDFIKFCNDGRLSYTTCMPYSNCVCVTVDIADTCTQLDFVFVNEKFHSIEVI